MTVWHRWALARSALIRQKIKEATGIYNQWPIVLGSNWHYLPIGRNPEHIICLANDN